MVGEPRIHTLLRGAILADSHERRYELLDAAGRIGVDANRDLPLFVELLDADHWFAVSLAAWEIGKLGPAGGPAVPALVRVVEREEMIDPRWAALWAFERLGPAAQPAVPAVIRVLLNDHEPDMRSGAAWALGRVGIVDGVQAALEAALDDPDSLAREEAATSLGLGGPAQAASAGRLAGLGGDPVAAVRRAAARALRRMREPALATEVEAAAADVPAPAALTELLERAASADARTRAETTWPIGKFGSDGGAAAAAMLNQLRTDHDPDARWGAAWCLGRIGRSATDTAVSVAESVREDPDPDIRAQAARALGLIGQADRAVVDALVEGLGDAGASLLREEAAIALGRLREEAAEAAPVLRDRLTDPHPLVRGRAEAALVSIQGYS
jgi:HEAT repeat protein